MDDRILGVRTFNEWKSRMFHQEYCRSMGPVITIRKLLPEGMTEDQKNQELEQFKSFWSQVFGQDDESPAD